MMWQRKNFKKIERMKKLDLKEYGVQEMNAEEMLNIEGGNWYADFKNGIGIIMLIILILACF